MRFIKVLPIVAASMLLLSIFSSNAQGSTALCKVHQDPCAAANQVKHLHLVTKSWGLLIGFFPVTVTAACKESLYLVETLGLGEPQTAHLLGLFFGACASESSSCEVVATKLGLFNLTKTALNLGTVKSVNTQIKVKCGEFINCEFGGESTMSIEGAGHTAEAGNGMLTATEMTLSKVAGGFTCPQTAKLNALYEALDKIYVVS